MKSAENVQLLVSNSGTAAETLPGGVLGETARSAVLPGREFWL